MKQTVSVGLYEAKFKELNETMEEKLRNGLSDLMELFYFCQVKKFRRTCQIGTKNIRS